MIIDRCEGCDAPIEPQESRGGLDRDNSELCLCKECREWGLSFATILDQPWHVRDVEIDGTPLRIKIQKVDTGESDDN